jgi:tRNA A37 threonylcarbamoyladenosine modification protein TsaB
VLAGSEFLLGAQGWTVVTPDPALAEAARAQDLPVLTLPPITAAVVISLGWRKLQRGDTVTPEQLEANYIRRTDAEMLEKSRS